jgi:hypothetical protein
MNQRHAKWVEFLQIFTVVIKHTSGKTNIVIDTLSRINFLLQELQVNTLGCDSLTKIYTDDVDLKEAYASFEKPVSCNKI